MRVARNHEAPEPTIHESRIIMSQVISSREAHRSRRAHETSVATTGATAGTTLPRGVRPLRVVAPRSSGIFERYRAQWKAPAAREVRPEDIAPPFVPNTSLDLSYRGGKTIAHMTAQFFYVNNAGNPYPAADQSAIDQSLPRAFADANLNSVMAQYFVEPITSTFLPSVQLNGSLTVYQASDVEQLVRDRFADGTFTGDFANTCFCILLPPGVRLFGPFGEDSYNGLGGYHFSVDCQGPQGTTRVYYAIGVYPQVLSTPQGPQLNGFPMVFANAWECICAVFYHELNEFRTDCDADAGLAGWYNDADGEIGDIPIYEADGNFASVIMNVALADGTGIVPVQLMYSNKDHGPSAGDEIPWLIYHDWQVAPNATWNGTWPLGGYAKQLVAARNQDDRIEVFYIGTDDGLYHDWQVAPNGTWYGERPLGGAATQIAVATNPDGTIELFYVGTDTAIYHNWQTTPNGGWAGEHRLGGYAKQIAVGCNQDGRLEIVYVGTNDRLYHNWKIQAGTQSWYGEVAFAEDSAKQVAIAANEDKRLEIFYVGTNDTLYHNWQLAQNGATGWSGETAFSGDSAKQLAVGMNEDGRLEIFYVGTNNGLYHNWQVVPNGVWFGENRFGTSSALQVAVGSNEDGRLEIFYVGTDTNVYHNWQTTPNGGWAQETRIGGQAKQVAVASNQDGRIELFYIGD
jgi:hypothetical protein